MWFRRKAAVESTVANNNNNNNIRHTEFKETLVYILKLQICKTKIMAIFITYVILQILHKTNV